MIFDKSISNISYIFFRWFFGNISRSKAEDYLQFEANVNGTYLIRSSGKNDNEYYLALKSWEKKQSQWEYKNYLIAQNENKTLFWFQHEYV